jgi:hypothetical protein
MENDVNRPLAAAEFEQQAMASDQLGPEMDTADAMPLAMATSELAPVGSWSAVSVA